MDGRNKSGHDGETRARPYIKTRPSIRMAWIHPAAVEHRRKLYTRHDAWRFTPEAKIPGWLDPSATRVRLKEAQEAEARAREAAAQEEFERDLLQVRWLVKSLRTDLLLLGVRQKYSPDQPRMPAGSPQGGQWTSGASSIGDAAAANSSDTSAPVDESIWSAQLDGSGETLSDAATAPFGPDRQGWHDYRLGPNLACAAELRCSREEMADQFARFSLPGRDPSMPIEDEGIYRVHIPGTDRYVGDVETRIDDDGLTIENRTKPSHLFSTVW